jgi:hypothetical protein
MGGLAIDRLPGHHGRMMTGEDYRDAIGRLGFTMVGASRFLSVGERTSRRWASGEIEVPRAVELLFKVMLGCRLTPDDVLRIEIRRSKASASR